jgi:hypothetical protein
MLVLLELEVVSGALEDVGAEVANSGANGVDGVDGVVIASSDAAVLVFGVVLVWGSPDGHSSSTPIWHSQNEPVNSAGQAQW